MSAVIPLEGKLDFAAIPALVTQLKAAPAGDVVLDASEVSHLGAQALQVILATVRSRAAAGASCTLADPTGPCIDQLSLFGFTPESLCVVEDGE